MLFKTYTIVGKSAQNVKLLKQKLTRIGLKFLPEKADIIICEGGDGTLLFSERLFPGIPKLLIRDSLICKQCPQSAQDHLIEDLKLGRITTKKIIKLSAQHKKQTFTAINDICLRNSDPTQAIRFDLKINGQAINKNDLVADGLVVATPYGSTAYFQSITRTNFSERVPNITPEAHLRPGIGLAFNNCTQEIPEIMLNENAVISVTLIRGQAQLSADNHPIILPITPGDIITIKKSAHRATVLASSHAD